MSRRSPPEVHCRTERETLAQSAGKVLAYIESFMSATRAPKHSSKGKDADSEDPVSTGKADP